MSSISPELIREQTQTVFRNVFNDDDIVLTDAMTADDVDGWDSLTHINLIIAVERQFGVKFATAEISGLKADDQNIGTFLKLIQKKLDAKR
jgi:acyl carrier protein